LPFGFQNFSKRYTPKTNFGLGYDYERRPDFNNKSVKASFGYQWSGNGFITHYLNPIELTATQILNISDTYKDLLLEKNIFADYSDKLISATNYTFVYSGKPNAITKNYAYFRTKIEAAGNIFGAFNQAVTGEKSYNEYLDYSAYHLLNLPFAQYMLTEAEYRYNYELPNGQKVVFRSYGGVGVPYGNFKSMPIQKQFMSGGLNSLRGWLPGYVGPGNYPVTKLDNTTINTISRIQQRGEVKLEANIEYRFKLISMLEGALFVDAGNIWTLSNYNISYINAQKLNEDLSKYQLTDRVQTQFALNNFYNQIALNTGFGARFDFSFFIFRLDFGLKVLDPGDNQIGLFRSGFFDRDIWRLNFGVGYPF
jgi:outer membrane protein assembly factor BamA